MLIYENIERILFFDKLCPIKKKRIVILDEVELRKTFSRLTSEIIEKVKNLDNLLLVGIPTRGIDIVEVLEKELFCKTGVKIKKGIIDPTFYSIVRYFFSISPSIKNCKNYRTLRNT